MFKKVIVSQIKSLKKAYVVLLLFSILQSEHSGVANPQTFVLDPLGSAESIKESMLQSLWYIYLGIQSLVPKSKL